MLLNLKKLLLPLLTLVIFFGEFGDVRAEGELDWQFNSAPASVHYTDVAISSRGAFSPRLVSWGEVTVQKRNLDNSGGWQASFPIPVNSWFNGHPRIAVDSTGVYVALSSAVTLDVRNGTLSMAKLSPIDGSILSIVNSNAPGYVNVTNIEVDSTGVYIAGGSSADRGYGGTSWRLEKWNKNLSGMSPIWGYSSKHSGGNAGDYWGPLGFAMNNQYLYLGGNRLHPASGQLGVRIEKINKNTGAADWVRLEGYGTGAVGVLALSDTNLYSVLSNSYWGGAALGAATSVFEIRPLDNSPAVSSAIAPGRIHALAVDGVSGLYRGYVITGDGTSRTVLDKVSLVDGSQIGTLNVNTGVYSVTKYPSGFGFATPIVNNIAIDNTGIYIAGKDESELTWGLSGAPRIEKYKHFGFVAFSCGTANAMLTATAPSPTPPSNLCTSGTIATVTDSGESFDWTCDGPDGTRSTEDDVSCSAPKDNTSIATIIAPHCTIPAGSNSCSIAVSWSSSGTTGPVSVRQDNAEFSTNTNSSGTSRTIPYGTHIFTFFDRDRQLSSDDATASCDPDVTHWDGTICEELPPPPTPPVLNVSANPNLIRSGQTASVTVGVNTSNSLKCLMFNAQSTPIDFTHSGRPAANTYSFVTQPLTAGKIVTVQCTDASSGLVGTGEARIDVVPAIQEI